MITMADENERKIPVFTVLKNNVILKNIFVIDQPPPGTSEPERPEHVLEEILMVGRHPDCNIMLTHPSISRFHLQIYSNPRLQKLAVMDLSSVHGTWVSEEKIKPCVRVELKEGDTIRLGSSSRIYRLHWVPLSRAFDLENPFVSALDVLMEEEKEEEISQDENSFSVDSKEIQSVDTVRKGMESFFTYENCEPFAEKPIPSAPPELEISDEGKREGGCLSVVEAFHDTENQSPSKKEYEQTESAVNLLPSAEVFLETRSEQLDEAIKSPHTLFVSDENCEPVVEKPIPSAPPELENMNSPVSDDEKSEGGSLLVVEAFEGTENQIPSRKEYEQMGMLGAVNSLPSAEVLLETRSEQWGEDIKSPQNLFVSDENCEPAVEKPILSAPPEPENLNSPVSDEGKRETECIPVVEAFEELENQIPPGKEYEQTEMLSAVSLLPSAEVFLETRNEDLDEEIKSPQPPFVSEVFSQGEMPVGLPTKSGPNSKLLGSLDSSVADDKIELPLVAEAVEEVENQSPPRKVYEQRKDSGLYHGALTTESVNSKLLGSLDSSVADDKIELPLAAEAVEEVENQSPPRKVYEQREDSGLYHGALTTESVNSKLLGSLDSSVADDKIELPLAAEAVEEVENQSPPRKVYEQREDSGLYHGALTTESVNSKLLGSLDSSVADDKIELPLAAEAVEEVENQSPPRKVYEQREDSGLYHGALTTESVNSKLLGSLDSSVADDKIELPLEAEAVEEVENQSPPRKVYEQREDSGLYHGALTTESVNSSVPDRNVFSDIGNQQFSKENQAPKPLSVTLGPSDENQESPPGRLEQNSGLPNIWSRRGKPASVLQIQTGRSRKKSVGGGSGAKIRKPKQEDLENKQISKALLPELDGEEMEIFTPNKENFSPNTLLLKSMNKKGILVETKQSKLCRSSSSKFFVSPNNCSEEYNSLHSDKENQTPQVLQIQKSVRPSHENTSRNHGKLERENMVMKRGAERLPFHTLIENASGKSKSEVSVLGAKTRSSNSVNCSGTTGNAAKSSFGKRRWNMVVDSTCLLNKESRKSLQLLQGLKGTQLIIPRMVIRELDCLKRRGSLLRRTSEASLVLQWIEECMVKTKWWIHVQSSVEEGRPIAPTPPASPRPRFSEGSEGFTGCMTISLPFSACGSLMEIVSPTAEDHILEYALFFKKIKNDGQLVLLTNDVTLKIKAMAEGLICETVEEFRESLVNPFSERFMWSESSPRGQTWSCLDDVVLREKYYPCPLKKASKGGESAKGLKLILLHNSHYRKISSTTS